MISIRRLTLALVLSLTLVLGAGLPAQAATKLRISHNAGPGQPITEGIEHLAKIVGERTDGRVEIEIFPNNILGNDLTVRDMLVEGTVDMQSVGNGFLANWTGAMQIVCVYYAYNDEAEMHAVHTGKDFGQKYFHEPFLKERGVRILDMWPQSPRHLISKRPVRSQADMKGLKLRTPVGIPVYDDLWGRLGVMPMALALEDAFTGMQQGVCDAVEMPLDFMRSYRFAEVAKYLTLTHHLLYDQLLLINENSFNKLSDGDKKILTDAVAETSKLVNDKRLALDAKIMEEFKAMGVEVIELSPETVAEFQQIIEPVFEDRAKDLWTPQIAADFKAAIKNYREANAQ
ncbi:MAG: TRAP transporter substrate-binding protein [Candidatus Adiutrix sp.]|jgi:tripartite ATP-independent transporter DctP family solute receptor|nr:TRAP transporter substrate-binding protein [Candidatus Adiutrix sp.]